MHFLHNISTSQESPSFLRNLMENNKHKIQKLSLPKNMIDIDHPKQCVPTIATTSSTLPKLNNFEQKLDKASPLNQSTLHRYKDDSHIEFESQNYSEEELDDDFVFKFLKLN